MVKNLDILVVEDKPKHQESAEVLIGKDNNVRITGTYSEAIRALDDQNYDMVLSDMKFPLGEGPVGDIEEKVEPRDLGYAVGLYAARPHIAVPKIGILTDTNHHSDAISATFDQFVMLPWKSNDSNEAGYKARTSGMRPAFRINESYFVMFDERDLPEAVKTEKKGIVSTEDLSREEINEIIEEEQENPAGYSDVKNWKELLNTVYQSPSTTYK
ncbi:MAG: hypothetical protein ACQER9_02370 [Nanobdellota archaeon]